MSCGAAAVLLGLLATIFGGQASQQDTALVSLPTNPTTLQNQCTWLDHLALPISDILEPATSSPLCIPTRDPLQCSWAEHLNFLDWNATPAVAAFPPQPQSQWLDQLAGFDRSDAGRPAPGVILGHVATFNVFTLVASTVAFWAVLKLSRWVWLHREKLAPYLLTITIFSTYDAALAVAPNHLLHQCCVFLIPYICSTTSWAFGKLLLLRDPITHKDYQTLLDRVESLTKSLATVEIAKHTTEKDLREAKTASTTKITCLENQLSEEQSKVTKLTVESEKTSGDKETLTEKNHSLMVTTDELTESIAGLHKERESTARHHFEVLEQHALKVSELNIALASTTEHVQDLKNDTEAKTTQIEALNARIADMERDFHTSNEAQATAMAQLSDAADDLSLEKKLLTTENDTLHADNANLQQQLATLVEEKAVLAEDIHARTSEVTELKAWLSSEKDQTERHAEQAEAQAAEIAQLRNTLDSLREALAAVNDAPRMGSPLEAQIPHPTDSLVDSPSPYAGTSTTVDHVSSIINAEVVTGPLPELQPNGMEGNSSNLDAVRQSTNLQGNPFDKALDQDENTSIASVSAALPPSPPVTPPSNTASLFPSPDTPTAGLVMETSFSNAPLASALDLVTAPTAESAKSEPSHVGPTAVSGPRKPRSLVDRALGAIHTGEAVPTSSRTPATPTEASAANTRPHSWDVLPDRVYPPNSGSRVGGRASSTQPKHRGPRLGGHFHREKKSSGPS